MTRYDIPKFTPWTWPNVALTSDILVNFGSGNGLLLDGTKLLPKPMLTYLQLDW